MKKKGLTNSEQTNDHFKTHTPTHSQNKKTLTHTEENRENN